MDFLYQSYISWFQFVLLAIVIYCIYYLANRFKSKAYWLTGLHNLSIIHAILAIILVLSFIMINPFVHGLIILVALVLFFPVLTSYFKGMIVTNNSKIEIGDHIKIGKHEGKVAAISIAGVKLVNEKNNLFVPYKMVSSQAIEKFKSNQSSFVIIQCQPQEDQKMRNALTGLQRTVFNFPFLEPKSRIEVKQIDDHFEVHLTIANDRFKTSLFNRLEKAGFTIINKLNKKI